MRIDGNMMTDRKALHACLKETLALPDYYGANLDALNDCLGEIRIAEQIEIINSDAMFEYLGSYAGAFIRVLQENGITVRLD